MTDGDDNGQESATAKDATDGKAKKSDSGAVKAAADKAAIAKPDKLSAKDYDRELKKLHVELVKLQQWVVAKGLKVCILFEGRDGAGKGGTIKAITERVSPRVFRVDRAPRADRAREDARCTCSATSRTCRRRARSSSSTAAGTTARASSG